MQIYHFTCRSCGFESKQPLGRSDLDQILTDVNADFAEYHLFICKTESKFVHADIHSKDFEGKCPCDGNELIEIGAEQEISLISCPRCNQDPAAVTTAPLGESDR